MTLLLSSVLAATPEMAFDCPVMVEPADGFRYADPGSISVSVEDALVAWIRGRYDPECPAKACAGGGDVPCAYTDDCVTTGGDHIIVDYAYDSDGYYWLDESWDVTVENDEGAVTLVSTHTYDSFWSPSYERDNRTIGAIWTLDVDARLPAAGHLSATTEFQGNYDDAGPESGSDRETAETGTCVWDLDLWSSGYYAFSEYETTRTIRVGDQTLEVPPGVWPTNCHDRARVVRTATLDGESFTIAADDWEQVSDADGDWVAPPDDCDDHDPDVTPCGGEDVNIDGIDQDCDGDDHGVDSGESLSAGSPSTGSPDGCASRGCAEGFLPLLLLVRARRR